MTNRKGLPKEMLSVNGSNFIGANKELQELVRQLVQEKITKSTANKGVKWHFNPPTTAALWRGARSYDQGSGTSSLRDFR